MKKEVEEKYKQIGARIKSAREQGDISQKKLADLVGFESANAIWLIENGQRRVSVADLEKIAEVTNEDVNYLLTGKRQIDTDVKIALRSDKGLTQADRNAIMHFIDLAKKKHANRK